MNSPIILHILSSAGIAGGERYLYDLIRHTGKSVTHKIILPCNGPFAGVLESSNFPFTIIPLKHRSLLKSLTRLIRIIEKEKVNIVHTHGYRANFYGRLACLFTRAKHMATIHVSLFDYRETPVIIRYCYILVESILSFVTRKFVCISRAMAHDLQKMRISRRKIVLVHNGIDLGRFHPRHNKTVERTQFKIAAKMLLIGTAGRMVEEKGQIVLLQALALLKRNGHPLKCLFLGEGPLMPFLKQKARELGILDICVFAGVRKDIERIYPILDLFVLPSLREPFGLVLLEAMACGVPVVATACGGPSEFIEPGKNGELVAPHDHFSLAVKIIELLSNKPAAEKLAREGLKTVKDHFDIYRTARETEKIYLVL